MKTRLIEIGQHELHPTLRALSDAGATTDDAAWMRKPGNAKLLVDYIRDHERAYGDRNIFEISVEETLCRFASAYNLADRSIGHIDEVFVRLRATAPAWPKGRLAFRSLRIRYGYGNQGVAVTFKAHIDRLKGVSDMAVWDARRLRLAAGNMTHTPTVEWITFDLADNRNRDRVQHLPTSLADEGLAFAWLFPEYISKIDHRENPAFLLAGYQLDVNSIKDIAPWSHVPLIDLANMTDDGATLKFRYCSSYDSGYSVPFVK